MKFLEVVRHRRQGPSLGERGILEHNHFSNWKNIAVVLLLHMLSQSQLRSRDQGQRTRSKGYVPVSRRIGRWISAIPFCNLNYKVSGSTLAMLRCTSRTRSRQLASHRLREISNLNVGVQNLFSYQRLFSVLFFFPSTSLCRVKESCWRPSPMIHG